MTDDDNTLTPLQQQMQQLLQELPVAMVPIIQMPTVDACRQAFEHGIRQQLQATGGVRPTLILVAPIEAMIVHGQPMNLNETWPEGIKPSHVQMMLDCLPFLGEEPLKALLSNFGHWLAEKTAAVCCAYISEVWFVHGPQHLDCPPSEHPQRKEAVIFDFEYQPHTREFRVYEIDHSTEPPQLGRELTELNHDMTTEGRFCNWLPALH
jgi:hypothetical protein